MKKLIIVSFIVLFVSCSKDDSSNCGCRKKVEIKSKATILDFVSTRAPNENIPDEARVVVSTTQGDYTTLYKDGTMSFSGVADTLVGFDGGPVYFPSTAPQIYMAGFNPAFQWSFAGNLATKEINGHEDLLGSVEVPTNRFAASLGNYPTLAFKHILTQLLVQVAGDTNASIVWGTITGVSLYTAQGNAVTNGIQFNIVTGESAIDTAAEEEPLVFSIIDNNGNHFTDHPLLGQAIALTTTQVLIGYTMCAPVVATDTDPEYALLVTTSNQPAGVLIPINLKDMSTSTDFTGATQGYRFTISLTFIAEEIKAQAIIQPWLDGGIADEEVI